jgi:hypothetical protein
MSCNLVIEVAQSNSWWQSNVLAGDCIIRATNSNMSIYMSTDSNAAYMPLGVHDGVVTIPNLSNPQLTWSSNTAYTACNALSSYSSALTYCSNTSTTASNSTFTQRNSNFCMTWGGGIALGSNQYVYQTTNWNFLTGFSYCPNSGISNLVASCMSNGRMKPPIKGLYSFDYTMGLTTYTGYQQVWFDQSNAQLLIPRAATCGSNIMNLAGSFTSVCSPGDTVCRVIGNFSPSNNTQWYSTVSMTLHYPLP